MSHDPRYTQATRELVSAAIASAGHCDHPGAESCAPWWHADAALTALADAGLLVAPSTSDGPRTWALPAEPGPEVKTVMDRHGVVWRRPDAPIGWSNAFIGSVRLPWSTLLVERGPLLDVSEVQP